MRRVLLFLAALALCGPAWAQIDYKPAAASGAASSISPGVTTIGTSTNCFGYADGSSLFQCDNTLASITTAAIALKAPTTLGTAYGADMVTNGTFTGSATGWTLGLGGGTPDWFYNSNNVSHANGGGTATLEPSTPLTVVAGRTYRVTFTLSSLTAGTVTASIGGTSGTASGTNGTFVLTLVAADTTNLKFTPTTTLVATIDSISVLESKAVTVANLTAGRIPFAASGGRLTDSGFLLADESGGGDAVFTLRKSPSGSSTTSNFLNITATAPALTGQLRAFYFLVTTAAESANQIIRGLQVELPAGNTGNVATAAVFGVNNIQATGANLFGVVSNAGTYGIATNTTTGTNVGSQGVAGGGDLSVGLFGRATQDKNGGKNAGVIGLGGNNGTTPVRVGGYFGLDAATPTLTDAALIANNASIAAPIQTLQDAGVTVDQVIDGGARWAKVGTKTLTESSATLFVRVDVASSGRQGGLIEYCVDADDATDFQTRCGSVSYAGENKAGTEVCGVGTPADAVAVSTGTLTVSFDTETAGTNQCGIRANAVSSLTQTTLRINYTVREAGNAATAVTAQ